MTPSKMTQIIPAFAMDVCKVRDGVQGPRHRLWGVQQQQSDVRRRLHEGLSCVHDMWPARASLASNRDKGGRFHARLLAQNALHDALEASHMRE